MKNIKNLIAVFGFIFAVALSVSAQGTTLTSTEGEKVNVQGQKDKVVVLAVGAIWLPLSKDQVVIVNKLAKKYAGRVEIYFVATDSTNAKSKNFASDDDLRSFASKNKLGVTMLRDSDGLATLKKFEIDQLPSFVVLDKSGNPVQTFGGIDPKNDVSIPISQTIDKIL